MKNRLLMMAIAALSVGAMVSCGPTVTPSDGGDVPTEEGKVTFYFTAGESSLALESYESFYLTGGWLSFATGKDALEFKQIEGKEVYYVIADAPDTSLSQGNEYQILRGYNSTSNMPDSKQGLQWVDSYKSDEELEFEALKNPSFTYVAGDKTIDLGTHTFSTKVSKPSDPLKNYALKFTFKTAVPDWGVPMIFGSFNGWVTPGDGNTDEVNTARINAAKLTTTDAERKVWTYALGDVYANSYEYKLLVEYTSSTTSISWNAVEGNEQNLTFNVMQADGDNYVLDMGEVNMDFETKLPDPSKTATIKFVFKNSGTAGLAEGVEPGIAGNFTNWKYTAMTKDSDVWSLTLTVTIGAFECGIVNMNDGTSGWTGAIVGEDGNSNLKFTTTIETKTVTFEGDYSKLGQASGKSAGKVTVA